MIINPVYNEIWEPWVFSTCLEKLVEKFKTFLAKVIAKHFEAHKSLILTKSLSKESKTHIVDLIVSHVKMNETLVNSNSLSNGLSSVIWALVVC